MFTVVNKNTGETRQIPLSSVAVKDWQNAIKSGCFFGHLDCKRELFHAVLDVLTSGSSTIDPLDALRHLDLLPNYVYSKYYNIGTEGNFLVCDVHTYFTYKYNANGQTKFIILWIERDQHTVEQALDVKSKIIQIPGSNEIVINNP